MRIRPVTCALVALAAYGFVERPTLDLPVPDAIATWQQDARRDRSCHIRAIRALSDAGERGLDGVERDCARARDPYANLR